MDLVRADLDLVEETARTFAPDGWVREYVPPLVAELRAAREVVEAVRVAQLDPLQGPVRGWAAVARALDAYDQAVSR